MELIRHYRRGDTIVALQAQKRSNWWVIFETTYTDHSVTATAGHEVPESPAATLEAVHDRLIGEGYRVVTFKIAVPDYYARQRGWTLSQRLDHEYEELQPS